MTITIKSMALSLATASALLCASTVADAGGAVALTNGQLDRVTAGQGGPAGLVSAGAAASGLFAMGNTSTSAVIGVGDSPFDGSTAVVTATAFGLGSNGVSPGQSATEVNTFTEAPGNFVVNFGWNKTITGAGGATLQVGVSGSVANLVPGMP